jgi:diguanylate cyclase (GGDEF)-like protein/PAS domain S-box-containing protein
VIRNEKQCATEKAGFPLPEGLPLKHFMGLPLYNSFRLVGVLCLVNHKHGFDKRLAAEIETLLQPLAGLITAYQERTTLTESEARLRLLVDNAVEGIVTTNDKGNIITFNPAAERIFGYSKSQVMGRSIGILVPREQIREYVKLMSKMICESVTSSQQSNKELEAEGLHRNGKLIPLELSVTQIKTQQGIQFTGIIRDISDRKQQEVELSKAYADLQKAHELMEEQNRRDSLTGLANRRFLDQILAREWARTERKGSNELSIILCDIDYFKRYNDTYGHLEGDDCLRKVAKVLADSFTRKVDLVARYGGEEFMIVLPDTSAFAAVAMAEAMRKNILNLNVEHKSSPVASSITISVGVFTGGPAVSRNLNNAIQRADQALYRAKAGGRNQVVHDCKPACTCPPISDQTL